MKRILCIGASDSSAGTGIQADLKTIMALGGYAPTIVSAVGAQNTKGMHDIMTVPPDFLRAQIDHVLEDIGADAIKIGMLPTHESIECVAKFLDDYHEAYPRVPVILDPIMTNRSGQIIMDKPAMEILKRRLIPHCFILTPNIYEAGALCGTYAKDADDLLHVAEMLTTIGAPHVLLKGGSLDGDKVIDVYASQGTQKTYESKRLDSRATHGAGTTLSAALSMFVTQEDSVPQAIENARAYLYGAIENAEKLGDGFGPLNHRWKG